MDSESISSDDVFIFPCEFVIKIFGIASNEFEATAIMIIKKHVKELKENAIKTRTSKDGKYLALSITITAENRDQLDDIYRELSSNSNILMAL